MLAMGSLSAQSFQIKDLSSSLGRWEGNLTYLDYSSGKPFTMLADIKISLTADSRGYIMAYEYPKEPHANSKDTTAILRHRYLLQKNTFTITKSVKFQGTDKWIKRNEYLLTRAEN